MQKTKKVKRELLLELTNRIIKKELNLPLTRKEERGAFITIMQLLLHLCQLEAMKYGTKQKWRTHSPFSYEIAWNNNLIDLIDFKAENVLSVSIKKGLANARINGKSLGRKKIDKTLIEEIEKLKALGYSNRKISTELKISNSTVGIYVK